MATGASPSSFRLNSVDRHGRRIDPAVLAAAESVFPRALEYGTNLLGDSAVVTNTLEEVAATVSQLIARRDPPGEPAPLMVKKVVRRAEVKGHRHGFRVSGVLLIEAAGNPRPVHKRCHQTQHPEQDHRRESPRAWPESLPALSFGASQQVVQKQEET